MEEQRDRSLDQRLGDLEKAVADLQRMIRQLNDALAENGIMAGPSGHAGEGSQVPSRPLRRRPPVARSRARSGSIWKGEDWLNRIGIGLLLVGVAFLFIYSSDQGWLTPQVLSGFGLVFGAALLIPGVRIHSHRRYFSQMLTSGGIGTFYITGFAAFRLYTLVPHPVAVAFMTIVTVLAFSLSLHEDEAVLAIVGAVGGLCTPFLLHVGAYRLPGIMAYVSLVLAGTSAVYSVRGWRSLLWTAVLGSLTVFVVCFIKGTPLQAAAIDRWALQGGILVGWLVFWAVPVAREAVRDRIPSSATPATQLDERGMRRDRRYLNLLWVSLPLLVLALSRPIWPLANGTWGGILLGAAVLYGAAACGLRYWVPERHLAYVQALTAVVLTTMAFWFLFEGDALVFALASEAAVLHGVGQRFSDRGTVRGGHILYAVLTVWLGYRLVTHAQGAAVFNTHAITDLWVIATGVWASGLLESQAGRRFYRFMAHAAILIWFLRELAAVSDGQGQGYVTIAWGFYAVVLLVLGLRMNFSRFRTVAMGTLLVVVGKLLLIDLAMLDPIWRVLLFLGFGGAFLVLSYYFQALWRPSSKPAQPSEG